MATNTTSGKHADRTRDTASSVTSTTVNLNNAPPQGFQSFGTAYATTDVVPSYLIFDGTNWEVSYGAYTQSGPSLARASTPLASSNGGSQVGSFTGTIQVACVDPALNADYNVSGIYSGWYFTNAYSGPQTSTVSPAVGTCYFMPVLVNQWMSQVNLAVNISALAAATSTFALGIYSNSPRCTPLGRLAQSTGLVSGNQGGGATGPNVTSLLTLSIPKAPGLYWVGIVLATNTASFISTTATATDYMTARNLFGVPTLGSTDLGSGIFGWSQTSATLPVTIDSVNLTAYTSPLPIVGVAPTL